MVYCKCRLVKQNMKGRRSRDPIVPPNFRQVFRPPNFRQVWGYPKIKLIPIFLLLTSDFMFCTYQDLNKVVVGEIWGGGARWVVLAHALKQK